MKALIWFIVITVGLEIGRCSPQSSKQLQELNGLVVSIHAEILKLKDSAPWLSKYSKMCLDTNANGQIFINYTPQETRNNGPEPQQSSHLSIRCIDIDQEKRGKYWNVFEDSPDCKFPLRQAKLYGEVLVWEDRKLEKRLVAAIIDACKQWHIRHE